MISLNALRRSQITLKISTIALSFLMFSGTINAQATKTLKTIVLDAGHGGKDPGARGKYSNEKDITLAVVLRLGKILKDSMPQLNVIYTRRTDDFIDLKERGPIGNRANGDFFLAIHVNSTAGRREQIQVGTKKVGKGKKKRTVPVYKTIIHRETSTSGTETYVLGLKRAKDEKEKAIGEYAETVTDEPGLLDKDDPMTSILIAQYSQAFLGKSVTFGGKLQAQYAGIGRNDLGVKQMSLQVLANSTMPGVLTEIGFINNPDEEDYLNSQEGQNEIAMCLYRAIKSYKESLEGRGR
ncbi:N-acetylmuramoyl-L-alanine amidase [Taibaiella lutea]|uniref:N-acetylmuramoyl-L-alanine amidase n=1 Tax=Taibaiella lutea TaxID=2608001 RepID=A0A5M6CVT3_9BACT|nr:N-acetylmuramoyl-L-alanine amidase [Taibaiella lutea]KAA5537025.1 N-acetylmuramoyl-L-alanine amidase [Taibaiella lutea]